MILNYLLHNFLVNVNQYPKKNAIEIGFSNKTYEQLLNEAVLLAIKIIEHFGDNQVIVGVLSNKNHAAYTSIITAQLIGATVVPLNVNFPVTRTLEIIKLASVNYLVYDSTSVKYFKLLDDAYIATILCTKFEDI